MIETENDKQDAIVFLTNQLVDQACRVVALSKEKQTNVDTVVFVDNDGNDVMVNVYDHKTVKMTSVTTFDKLAQEEYGDPSLGTLIAYYNKIQNEHSIEAGTTLRIPVLSVRDQNLLNRIYAPPELQNNYGSDIALTDNGGFRVNLGDLALVRGARNLHQAIGNRLTTASGKRIRVGAYGIRNSIGDPIAMGSYLMASIEQTMNEDPRIASVDNIRFEGKGDKLHITVSYTDINFNQNTYIGEI